MSQPSRLVLLGQFVQTIRKLRAPASELPPRRRPAHRLHAAVVEEEKLPGCIREMLIHHRRTERRAHRERLSLRPLSTRP